MSYMRKNVNIILLFIVMILIGSFIVFTTYYQTTYKNLSVSYNTKLGALENLSKSLSYNQERLNETYVQLQVKQEDVSKFDVLYSNLTDTKKRLERELASTKTELANTKSSLASTQDKLYSTETQLTTTQQSLNDANLKILALQGDISSYKSQITSLQNQIASLKQQCGIS